MKEYRFDPEIQLDFKSLIPLRVQLFEKIRKSVIRNRIPSGTRVISESQIAKAFSINRGTVHLAYTDLIRCGLFETKSARSGVRISANAEKFYRIPFPTINLVLPSSFQEHIRTNNMSALEYTGGILDRAAEKNFSVNIVALPSPDLPPKKITEWLEGFLHRSVGTITMGSRSTHSDPVFEALINYKNLPHVFLTGKSSLPHISTVTADVTDGVKKMLKHLKKKKVDSLLFLDYIPANNPLFIGGSIYRIQEAVSLARKQGFRCKVCMVENRQSADKTDLADLFLAEKDPYRAVFAINDEVACRFMDEMQRKGFSIPEDVLVIGYDNNAPENYSLSSIYHNRSELGKTAVDMIIDLYHNAENTVGIHRTVPTNFIARKSSGN